MTPPAPMPNQIVINGRPIGPKSAPYIVAEMSANHGGKLDTALRVLRERGLLTVVRKGRLNVGPTVYRVRAVPERR